MKNINIKTPAKINLVLEILGKRSDGFHEIQSIMQAVSLFDYLSITIENTQQPENKITLTGNTPLIPYDENNLVFKAADIFLKKIETKNCNISINIEKNIPVAAGLAGGSSNAAGTLWGLNKLLENPLNIEEIHFLAASLGSDVNFCLEGGTCTATSRGEKIERIPTPDLKIIIIKPSNLGISAKEAYTKYADLKIKPEIKHFEQMKKAVINDNSTEIASLLNNDLEKAILPDYPEIEKIKEYLTNSDCINAVMSGSGPSVFGIYEGEINLTNIPKGYEVFKACSLNHGVTAY